MKKITMLILVGAMVLTVSGDTEAATDYDIFVDIDNNTGIEDGTEVNPYNTIEEAIILAQNNDKDNRKIFIAEGEYREQLDLTDDIELYGAGDDETVLYGKDIEGDRFDYVVKMRDHTKLEDLQVKYGDYGVVINDNDKAEIEDCKIKKYKEVGIYVEKGQRNDKDLFTLEDSKVYDSDGKGIYIRKRKISIKDSEVYDNDEEGIDIRSSVKGKIKNNEIHDNGESGIELELRKVNLKFTNNDIDDNSASGVTAQYRGRNEMGNVVLKGNEIEDSGKFAINCSKPSGKSVPPVNYFSDSITLIRNEYKDNKNLYGLMCRF